MYALDPDAGTHRAWWHVTIVNHTDAEFFNRFIWYTNDPMWFKRRVQNARPKEESEVGGRHPAADHDHFWEF